MEFIYVMLMMPFIATVWSVDVFPTYKNVPVLPPYKNIELDTRNPLNQVVYQLVSSSTRAKTSIATRVLSEGVGGAGCQLKELSHCISSVTHKFFPSETQPAKKKTRLTLCMLGQHLQACVNSHKSKCLSPNQELVFSVITRIPAYLCTQSGFNNYLAIAPCLSNGALKHQLHACASQLSKQATRVPVCTLLANYTSCATKTSRDICSAAAADAVKNLITFLLAPVNRTVCSDHRTSQSRHKREAGEGGVFGGGSQEEPAGQTSAFSFSQHGAPGRLQRNPALGRSWNLLELLRKLSFPTFSWNFPMLGQRNRQQGIAKSQRSFIQPNPAQQELSQASANQEPNSEEVPNSQSGVPAQESPAEESPTIPLPGAAAEPSEEDSTASPDLTTEESSSEESTTTSPNESTTENDDSSEEILSDGSTAEPSSNEEATAALDATTTGPSSGEVTEVAQKANLNVKVNISVLPVDPTNNLQPRIGTPQNDLPFYADLGVQPDPAAPYNVVTLPPSTSPPPVPTEGYRFPPFQCYECHSGAAGQQQNKACPSNGQIQGSASFPVICYGQCVSVVTRLPKGDVHRTCSSNYYLPFNPPYDGCVRHNKDTYCFCSGDFCNNHNLVAEQNAFLSQFPWQWRMRL